MARNVEIKARVADLPELRRKVATLVPTSPAVLVQTDTFFDVGQGRLKLRQLADGAGELIAYQRPDRAGPRESTYLTAACPDPGALAAVLGSALGVRGVVVKRREVFLKGRTRIHLDEVEGLGSFLELEVVLAEGEAVEDGEREARALLAALEVSDGALVAPAYIDLLEQRSSAGRGYNRAHSSAQRT